jgi:hypothetical protein
MDSEHHAKRTKLSSSNNDTAATKSIKIVAIDGSTAFIPTPPDNRTVVGMKGQIAIETGIPQGLIIVQVLGREQPLRDEETFASIGRPDQLFVYKGNKVIDRKAIAQAVGVLNLRDENIIAFCNNPENQRISSMDLRPGALWSETTVAGLEGLAKLEGLQTLNLSGYFPLNRPTQDLSSTTIAERLGALTWLQDLSISNCCLPADFHETFAALLTTHLQQLERLDLSITKLTIEGFEALANSLVSNTSLQDLSVARNRLGIDEEYFRNRARADTQGIDLTHHRLTQLGERAGKVAAALVKGNSTLTSLDLRSVCKSPAFLQALLPALRTNSSLQHLNLLMNGNTEGDARQLLELVRANKQLRTLCGITSNVTVVSIGGVAAPADALLLEQEIYSNGILTTLALTDAARLNFIRGQANSVIFVKCGEHRVINVDMVQVDLSSCFGYAVRRKPDVCQVQTGLILTMLSKCNQLTSIDMSSHLMSDQSAERLTAVLKAHSCVTSVNALFNPFGKEQVSERLKVSAISRRQVL